MFKTYLISVSHSEAVPAAADAFIGLPLSPQTAEPPETDCPQPGPNFLCCCRWASPLPLCSHLSHPARLYPTGQGICFLCHLRLCTGKPLPP